MGLDGTWARRPHASCFPSPRGRGWPVPRAFTSGRGSGEGSIPRRLRRRSGDRFLGLLNSDSHPGKAGSAVAVVLPPLEMFHCQMTQCPEIMKQLHPAWLWCKQDSTNQDTRRRPIGYNLEGRAGNGEVALRTLTLAKLPLHGHFWRGAALGVADTEHRCCGQTKYA